MKSILLALLSCNCISLIAMKQYGKSSISGHHFHDTTEYLWSDGESLSDSTLAKPLKMSIQSPSSPSQMYDSAKEEVATRKDSLGNNQMKIRNVHWIFAFTLIFITLCITMAESIRNRALHSSIKLAEQEIREMKMVVQKLLKAKINYTEFHEEIAQRHCNVQNKSSDNGRDTEHVSNSEICERNVLDRKDMSDIGSQGTERLEHADAENPAVQRRPNILARNFTAQLRFTKTEEELNRVKRKVVERKSQNGSACTTNTSSYGSYLNFPQFWFGNIGSNPIADIDSSVDSTKWLSNRGYVTKHEPAAPANESDADGSKPIERVTDDDFANGESFLRAFEPIRMIPPSKENFCAATEPLASTIPSNCNESRFSIGPTLGNLDWTQSASLNPKRLYQSNAFEIQEQFVVDKKCPFRFTSNPSEVDPNYKPENSHIASIRKWIVRRLSDSRKSLIPKFVFEKQKLQCSSDFENPREPKRAKRMIL